jgi:hypothetical protein
MTRKLRESEQKNSELSRKLVEMEGKNADLNLQVLDLQEYKTKAEAAKIKFMNSF